jgi:hypothetical protein
MRWRSLREAGSRRALGPARDVGRDVKHTRNHRRRGQAIGHPIAAFDDPASARTSQGWIRSWRRQSFVGRRSDSFLGSFEVTQQVDGCFQPPFRFEMLHQAVELSFGFRSKRDHALRWRAGLSRLACIRAMLARRRSSTGSSGTICPASICASLRSSDASIQSGGRLSGTVSIDRKLAEDRQSCQRWHKGVAMEREPRPGGARTP